MSHPGVMLVIEKTKNKGQNIGALNKNLLVGLHKMSKMAFIHQSRIIVEAVNFDLFRLQTEAGTNHEVNTLQPHRWMQWLVHFSVSTWMAVTSEINDR